MDVFLMAGVHQQLALWTWSVKLPGWRSNL